MNHQIEHYSDVGAPRWIRREPMRFDEARFGGDAFEIMKNRIESFNVTHLQDAILLLCQPDELRGLSGIVGHRFLQQDVLASGQECSSQLKMRVRGCDDAYRSAGGFGFRNRTECAHTAFFSDFSRRSE